MRALYFAFLSTLDTALPKQTLLYDLFTDKGQRKSLDKADTVIHGALLLKDHGRSSKGDARATWPPANRNWAHRILKLGARVVSTVRRVVVHLPESFPWRNDFQKIATALGATAGSLRAFLEIESTGISSVSHPFRSKNAEWMGHPRSTVKVKML